MIKSLDYQTLELPRRKSLIGVIGCMLFLLTAAAAFSFPFMGWEYLFIYCSPIVLIVGLCCGVIGASKDRRSGSSYLAIILNIIGLALITVGILNP